jgi:hypothetical protein
MVSEELRYFINVFKIARMSNYGKIFESNKCTEDMSLQTTHYKGND